MHLIHGELLDELTGAGFRSGRASWARTSPRAASTCWACRAARLRIGPEAIVEITGLRNPCSQLDDYQRGLTAAVLGRNPDGSLIRKAGVMGVVLAGGRVAGGDRILVELPAPPYRALERCSGASAIRPCCWGEDAARQKRRPRSQTRRRGSA